MPNESDGGYVDGDENIVVVRRDSEVTARLDIVKIGLGLRWVNNLKESSEQIRKERRKDKKWALISDKNIRNQCVFLRF